MWVVKMSYLPSASEGWGKVTFSVCSHLWGGVGWGGTLARSGVWGEYPMPVVGVPQPGLDGGGYPIPGLGWGVPWPGLDGGGVIPSQGQGVPSQVWMVGGTPSQV